MKQVLVYSDSLSWGIIPDTRHRLPFDKRWPGVAENSLNNGGIDFRIIENCLNGRRTAWSDPFKEGRDGSQFLAQVIEMHSPLALVILMLGTNDFQCLHDNPVWASGQGTAKLINIIRQAPIEPEMPAPEILLAAPPVITKPAGSIADKFKGAEKKCIGHARELEEISKQFSTHYFDANTVTTASKLDGIHLDPDQHQILGKAMGTTIHTILLNR